MAPALRPSLLARRRARPRDTEGGQTLVEFALIMPLFMVLVMGLIEFGLAFNATLSINQASQNAALLASEASNQSDADCLILQSVEADVQSPTDRRKVLEVQVEWTNPSGTTIKARNRYTRTGSMSCTLLTGTTISLPYTQAESGYPAGPALQRDRWLSVAVAGAHLGRHHRGAGPLSLLVEHAARLADGHALGERLRLRRLHLQQAQRLPPRAGAVSRRRTDPRSADPRARERGQGLVEFALVLPIFMLLLLIMLEFGLAFNHRLTVGYASREGARIGCRPGATAAPRAARRQRSGPRRPAGHRRDPAHPQVARLGHRDERRQPDPHLQGRRSRRPGRHASSTSGTTRPAPGPTSTPGAPSTGSTSPQATVGVAGLRARRTASTPTRSACRSSTRYRLTTPLAGFVNGLLGWVARGTRSR